MNTVLFAKCENQLPELFGEEWKENFTDLFKNIETAVDIANSNWDVFYHALIPLDHCFLPAPLMFQTKYANEEWAIKARKGISEWTGVRVNNLRINWSDKVGWIVSRA